MKKPYRILVVDDEPDLEPLILQRMRRKIRSGSYSFEFAHNGVEALEMLNLHQDIDMVVSDINMPQMDGLTLLEQIPKVDPDIRSIIISAYGDMKNIRTAMNRGAFDFVTKPLDFEDLQVTIDRTLRHLEEWREALASRDKLVALQNELDVASSTTAVDSPEGVSQEHQLPGLCQHGACAECWGRLLRRHSLRPWPSRFGHSGRVRQGRSRRPVHDVQSHIAERCSDRHG